MSAGVRELSGFWGRISGIKEIRAGLRELRVWEPQRDLEGSKQCFRSVFGTNFPPAALLVPHCETDLSA